VTQQGQTRLETAQEMGIGRDPAIDHHDAGQTLGRLERQSQRRNAPAAWPTTWARFSPISSISIRMSSAISSTVTVAGRVRDDRPVPR
jgi:hypothetical protein